MDYEFKNNDNDNLMVLVMPGCSKANNLTVGEIITTYRNLQSLVS